MRIFALACVCILVFAGCSTKQAQSPAGAPGQTKGHPKTPDPSQPANLPGPSSQGSQISDAERWSYAWNRAMEGVAMGSAVGGPFGAGGGLVLGLLAGLLTADAHYGAINAQIQTEQQKDKELEAQIEEELARQRELEAQLSQETAGLEKEAKSDPKKNQQAQRGTPKVQTPNTKDVPGPMASLGRNPVVRQPSPAPFKNVEIKDMDQDGVPDLWVYYNPANPNEVVRQEEDTNGDGRVDTWSIFYDSKLVRREIDSRGDGRTDRTLEYENDQLAREERYELNSREPSYRAFYENGRLARLEKDTTHDGRMDLWIYYDSSKKDEIIEKEEKDLNADGAIDLWSYYEKGRLVRRDVSAVGLEHLRTQGNEASQPSSPNSSTQEMPES